MKTIGEEIQAENPVFQDGKTARLTCAYGASLLQEFRVVKVF